MRRFVGFLIVGTLVACASAESKSPPAPSKDVTAGGARIRGGGVRMDVTLGRGLPNRPAKAGAVKVTP